MFYLFHLAVREHLLKHELGIFGDLTSKLIAKICLHVFLDPSFDRGPLLLNEDSLEEVAGQLTFQEISNLLRQHPFYVYLSHKWGCHARDCVADHFFQSLLIRFLDSRGGVAPANQVQISHEGVRQCIGMLARHRALTASILQAILASRRWLASLSTLARRKSKVPRGSGRLHSSRLHRVIRLNRCANCRRRRRTLTDLNGTGILCIAQRNQTICVHCKNY